jgi:hypothetical protein
MVQRFAQLLAVLLSAWFALWACAPAAAMRPMTGSMDEPNEFGGGYTYAAPLTDTNRCANDLITCNPGSNGQIWYQHRFGERFSLGGTLFGGQTSLFGGGVLGRFHLLESDRLQLGGDVSLGFAWGELGVPVAVRVAGPVWLYTEPTVAFRLVQPVRVPLGVAINLDDHFSVAAEGAWGFDPFFNPGLSVAETSYFSGSAGVSYRF